MTLLMTSSGGSVQEHRTLAGSGLFQSELRKRISAELLHLRAAERRRMCWSLRELRGLE